MRNVFSIIVLAILVLFVMSTMGFADDFKYVGVKKCKTCHKKESIGDQMGKWEKGPHAKAFTELSSDKAKEIAKKNGVADPTKDAKCLTCHTTMGSIDKALIDKKGKLTMDEGVSCESCHGPGNKYKSAKIMKKKAYDEDFAAAHKAAIAAGLVVPDMKLCQTCHKKNDMHEVSEWKYEDAVAKIAHPIPYRK